MLYNVKEDLTLCRELKLTAKQLMFVKMLYPDPRVDEAVWRRDCYAMALEYQDIGGLTPEELNDMLSRDIIIDLNAPGSKVYYDCFEINPKYQKLFSLKTVPWVSEIEDMYPRFFYMDTKKFNAMTVSAQEVSETYLRAINKDPKIHEEVKSLLKWAIDNDCIRMGFEKFIKTKHWLSIKMLTSDAKRTVNESKLG